MTDTPGPWRAEQADPRNPEDWTVLIGGYPYGSFLPADARLIAAAPDLLVALRRLKTWVKPWPGEAERAIAKAEGERDEGS